jgi:DNA-binding NarL/FixJ family response regulator
MKMPEKTSSDTLPLPICILHLDHHRMVREGLRLLIEQHSKFKVVGESGSMEQALEYAAALKPDLILLELNLDANLDLQVIPRLIGASPESRILLLTGVADAHLHHQAIQLGAVGVVLKSEAGQVLLKAIEKVHGGEVWIDRRMMSQVLAQLHQRESGGQAAQPPQAALSERENEVLELIGEGLKNTEIASRLSISEVTVRHHLTSIYRKLGVSDRLELIVFAYQNKILPLPP